MIPLDTAPSPILSWLPMIIAGLVVGVTAFFIVWIFIRRYLPPVEGRPLGHHQVIGLDRDGNVRLDVEGALVETPKFLNANNEPFVKQLLMDVENNRLTELNKKKETNADAIAASKARLGQLEKEDLTTLSRVVVLRDGLQKHVLLQWRHVARSLDGYAGIRLKPKYTLSFGFAIHGLILGRVWTEKRYEGKLPGFGRYQLHYYDPFIPFTKTVHMVESTPVHRRVDGQKVETWVDSQGKEYARNLVRTVRIKEVVTEPPGWLGELMMQVPKSVELHDELKSKDAQIVDLRRQVAHANADTTNAKAEADWYKGANARLGRYDTPEEFERAGRLDLVDFACFALPTAISTLSPPAST